MNDNEIIAAGVFMYEFEIEFRATREAVWKALLKDTNQWWLSDFRMAGPESIVTLDPRAGGLLLEQCPGGTSLLWYTVQFYEPELHTIHLHGHIAPEWGGPASSHLKLSIEAKIDGGSVLTVTDGLSGKLDDASVQRLQEGWTMLFRDGLRDYVSHGLTDTLD